MDTARRAVERDGEDPWGHFGFVHMLSRRSRAAIDELEEALWLNPNFALVGYRFVGSVNRNPDIEPGNAVASSAKQAESRPSLAVLPFVNLSDDREQDYFADGIVEDIIAGLSRLRWLCVIARNSTFAYKSGTPDVRQVAADLGVRYVLAGSVRKAGGDLRVSSQLIDANRLAIAQKGSCLGTEDKGTKGKPLSGHPANLDVFAAPWELFGQL